VLEMETVQFVLWHRVNNGNTLLVSSGCKLPMLLRNAGIYVMEYTMSVYHNSKNVRCISVMYDCIFFIKAQI
jgi:hypothetical protein